jgi:hypothetical protein
MGRRSLSALLAAMVVASTLALAPAKVAHAASSAATCTSSEGPGIPHPVSVAAGIAGFHASWYGQSGYPTLCPGARSTATVAYYNSGSLGWVSGQMGQVAYLGTWSPEPGQDAMTPLGGDGTLGSPATGWPRYNRIAIQPAAYVGPGQVAWFQFTIQAPLVAGTYRLYLRPLIEGAQWMEDYGVFWLVTVLNADGTPPDPPAAGTGYSFAQVVTSRGVFGTHVIKERLDQVTVKTLTANTTDCTNNCPVKPLDQYVAENGAYAGINGTYLCPPDYSQCAGKVNSYDYAVYNSNLRKWLNYGALNGQNGMLGWASATAVSTYRRSYVFYQAQFPVIAGITNYPLLLQNGAIIDSTAEQGGSQLLKGTKGAIGVDGTFVYLVIVTNATVMDEAYVMQALGARDALNLDGGGTAALWIGGGYKVGPGRLLPNATILTKP